MKQEKLHNLLNNAYSTITMSRFDFGFTRVYATQEPFRLYSGLTGALDAVTFKGNADNRFLDGWRKSMIDSYGRQQQEAYVNATADFGTLVHECLVRIWEKGKLDWEFEKEYATEYFRKSAQSNGLNPNEIIVQKQVFEFCKAAASLMYFVNENVAEIYAIEGMAKSDELEIATPLDLVFKDKKGKVGNVNIKTSSQLNDKHREQVLMEKFLWNETYDLKLDFTALLRTKDWSLKKGVPTYEYEVIEESRETLETILTKLALARANPSDTYLKIPKEQIEFSGQTILGEQPKFETVKIEEVLFGKAVEII